MFLTRSIRRKLTISLALVAAMLGLLAIGGINGLRSYGEMVDSLQHYLLDAPDRDELDRRICHLAEPLLYEPSPLSDDPALRERQMLQRSRHAVHRRTQVLEQLGHVRTYLNEYRNKLDQLDPTPGARERVPLSLELLSGIDRGVSEMHRLLDDAAKFDSADAHLPALRVEVARMLETVELLPDPREGLIETLDEAQSVYRSRISLVIAASIGTVILFIGLIWCGTRWIFMPISRLHEGVRRVARGDFSNRVTLNTNDEMSTLAEAFNQMTDRFQEIKEDLDRQVNERSKQLVRSERLAGVGFLAAGVAHEINNPLSAVTLAAGSLLGQIDHLAETKDPEEWEIARNYLEMIQREAVRCREITSRLLDFARGQNSAVRAPHDLAACIREVLSMIGHMSKYRNRYIKFEYNKPLVAEVNATEFKQVILNLVANALEAMDDGGTLTIEAQERSDTVVLSFADTGCGMTPEVLENLFEPFFTTKIGTKGTGLGLSITHGLVANHGGRMEVTSPGPGKGSTFRVFLPRKAAAKQAA